MFVITPAVLLILALVGGGTAMLAEDAEKEAAKSEATELAIESETSLPQAKADEADSQTDS